MRLMLLVCLAVPCILSLGCKGQDSAALTAPAQRRAFERILAVRGRLEAVETLNVVAGTEGKLAFMAPEGSVVATGDPLFGLETKEKEDALQRVGLDLALADSGRQRADEQIRSEVKKNEFALEEKTRQLEFAKLSASIAREDLEKKKRQIEKQILPKSELSAAELSVEQAELSVANAEIDLRRFKAESTSRAETLRLDRSVADARVAKAQADVDEARDFLAKATVAAPRDGVVIHVKNWRGVAYKVGDEVWNGAPVMELPDLSAMRIAVEINEVDVGQIAPGLAARVKVDAFPDLVLPGTLADVAAMAVEVKDREGDPTGLRIFEAKVSLAQQDARLRPGMTARVELVLETRPDALVVPTGAIGRDGAAAHVIMGDGSRRDVVVATSSAEHAVVESGLEEGEVVQISASPMAEAAGASDASRSPDAPSSPRAAPASAGGG